MTYREVRSTDDLFLSNFFQIHRRQVLPSHVYFLASHWLWECLIVIFRQAFAKSLNNSAITFDKDSTTGERGVSIRI